MDQNSTCKYSLSVLHSSLYRGLITGEVIASYIALGPNLLLAWIIWRIQVFPVNLRILLAFVSLTFAWLCLGDMTKNIYILASPPCAFTSSQMECRVFELATTSVPLPFIFYSLTALCIERMVATIIYNRYDNPKWYNKPYLAFGLIITVLITTLILYTGDAFSLPRNVQVPVCESSFLPTNPLSIYNAQIYLAMEITEACITIFVYVFNLHVSRKMAINRARFNLSSRFLISQNVQINRMVVPMMALHFIIHIPTFAASTIQKSLTSDPLAKVAVSHSTVLLRLFYATAHPIIAFYFSDRLRDQLFLYRPLAIILARLGVVQKDEARRDKEMTQQQTTRATNNLAVHFEHLDKFWEQATAPVKKMAARAHRRPPTASAWSEQAAAKSKKETRF